MLPSPFFRLMWSNLAAQAAEQMALAAAPLIAVLALGAGAAETGALAAVQTLPFLLLSLPAGLLADRVSKRRLMAAAELLRAAILLLLPVLLWADCLTLPVLALAGALSATGTVVYSVAAPALLPALVPRDGLTAANTRLELVRSLAFTAGPAVAGSLVALSSGGPAFALAALLSASAALLLWRLPDQQRATGTRRRPLAEIMEGLRFVRRQTLLMPIVLTAVAWNISWFILQAVYVAFAVRELGLDAASVGFTLASYGAGMVAGALLAPVLARRMTFGMLIATGPLVSVVAACLLSGSMLRPGPGLPMLGLFLFGAGPIVWTIAQTTLRQALTPPPLLGRVSALMTMATFGARPVGAAIGGFVGESYGLPAALALATAGFTTQAVIIMLSPVPRLGRLPEQAGGEGETVSRQRS